MPEFYDPAMIPRVGRRHPWRALARWCRLLRLVVVSYLLGWLSRVAAFSPEARRARELRAARRFREALLELGPTFIKLGQLLSTRADLLPLTYVRELEKLLDQVPPFPHEQAMQMVREDLGQDPSTLFARLSPAPISAASIAQVYRGTLPTGEEVAVKIQRPDLHTIFWLDLGILRTMARWAEGRDLSLLGIPISVNMPYVAIVDRLAKSLFDQADFVQEARNLEIFRRNFASFPGVTAPRPFWEYTSERVLTEEFVEGCRFSDYEAILGYGLDFISVANLGVRSFIKQVLEDGWFHADTHPGNVLVKPDGTVVYIDFGMVDVIPAEDQPVLVDLFIGLVNRDFEGFLDGLIQLGFLPADIDRARLLPIVEDVYTTQMGLKGDRSYTLREILDRVSAVLYEYPFYLPERFAFLMRCVASMEGVVLTHVAQYKFLEVGLPFAGKLLLSPERRTLRDKLVADLMRGDEVRLDHLQELFYYATREPTFRIGELMAPTLAFMLSSEASAFRLALGRSLLSPRALAPDGPLDLITRRLLADPTFDPFEAIRALAEFLETGEGLGWLEAIAPRFCHAGPHTALAELLPDLLARIDARHEPDEFVTAVLPALRAMLADRAVGLQPIMDVAAQWLGDPEGQKVAASLAPSLRALSSSLRREVLYVLLGCLDHPELDLAPLLGAMAEFATTAPGAPWRDLTLAWWSAGEVDQALLQILQRALRDPALRGALLGAAWPTMRFLLSPDSWEARQGLLGATWRRLWTLLPTSS